LRRLEKPFAVLDAFDVQHHGAGLVVILEDLDVVLDGDHRLVAGTGKGADADVLLLGERSSWVPMFPDWQTSAVPPGLG